MRAKEAPKLLGCEVLPEYQDEVLGVPVILKNGVMKRVYDNGDETFEIINERGLIAAVAMVRALDPLRLTGRDVRFFRKVLGLTATDFAQALNVAPETVSRWENDKRGLGGHGGFVDKGIRLFVCEKLREQAPALDYHAKAIAEMKVVSVRDADEACEPIVLELVRFKQPKLPAVDSWELPQAA